MSLVGFKNNGGIYKMAIKKKKIFCKTVKQRFCAKVEFHFYSLYNSVTTIQYYRYDCILIILEAVLHVNNSEFHFLFLWLWYSFCGLTNIAQLSFNFSVQFYLISFFQIIIYNWILNWNMWRSLLIQWYIWH